MDNQFMYMQQISSMNYFELVDMLKKQITPEIRKYILERLIIMNNELITNTNRLNNIKIDIVQPQKMYTPKNSSIDIGNSYNNNEIDIDDIIDDIHKEPNALDLKLARIKKLRDKILFDKKQRRKSKEKNI